MRIIFLVLMFCLVAVPATAATLTWTNPATNERGVEVERKAVACGTSGTFAKVADLGVDAVSYLDPSVVEGTAYCYRVRNWNTVDGTPTGTKQYSAWSNEAGATIPFSVPAAASGLTVTP